MSDVTVDAPAMLALGARARVADTFAHDPVRFRLDFTHDRKTKELRWVLFTAARRGCIGKIIFTLEKDATAHIKSIVVNAEWRGYGLARILYHACLATLHELGIMELHLEAEEDTKRHGKLVQLYETWGFATKVDAKVLFLYNDTECFRKVPMALPLATRTFIPMQQPSNAAASSPLWFCMLTLATPDGTCLVATEDGEIDTADSSTRRADSLWQTLLASDNTIALRSVHGKFLCVEADGAILADRQLQSTWETFEVVPHRSNCNTAVTNGGIALRNYHGTYLCIDAAAQRVVSSETPVAWTGSNELALVCNDGMPTFGQAPLHIKILRKLQTAAFVKAQTARFSAYQHAALSVADACALVVKLNGDGASPRDSWVLKYMLATAEAVRNDGHPDWLQLAFFLRALGMLFLCWIDDDAASLRSVSAREWLVDLSTWVVGARIPDSVGFSELNALNSDHVSALNNGDTAASGSVCSLDAAMLPWTPDEYLYRVLAFNKTSLPIEALQTVRFWSLKAWYKHDSYDDALCASQDVDAKDWLRALEPVATVSDAAVACADPDALMPYYLSLAAKYLPPVLQW